jgi:hypothetical protein
MAERVVRYKAVADFLGLSRDVRRAREEMEDLRREENKLNDSSAAGSAKADAADNKRQATRERMVKTANEYVRSARQAAQVDEQAARITRSRTADQSKYAKSFSSVVQSLKDYKKNLNDAYALESRAGGSARALTKAREDQARASKLAQKAAEDLAKAESNLASTQQRTAKEATAASQARERAANAAERAALNLVKAEERLNNIPAGNTESRRKAELSLSDARISSARAVDRLESAERRLLSARKGHDDDRIRRAELAVASAMQASASAASELESATKRVNGVMDALQGAGSGIGGVLGKVSEGMAEMASSAATVAPIFLAIIAALPILASLLNALVGALVSVGAAAVALVSALSPLVGLLGALPGAIAGGVFTLGVLAAAFMGVSDAVKESLNAQKNAGKVAKDAAKAQKQAARQVRDALRALRNAKEAQAQGEINADRSVKSAIQSLADARQAAADGQEQAAHSVTMAERSLRDAQENSIQVQKDLTQARKDAIRNIQDLQQAVDDAARSEKHASLDLEEAKQRLAEVMADPNATRLQKQEAELAVEDAMAALKDVKKQSKQAQADYADAQKKGVENSDAVVQAKTQERNALEGVKDAQYALAQAVKEQAKQQVEAQRSITEAQTALADALKARSKEQRDAAEAVQQAQENLADAYDNQKEAALTTANATQKLTDAMAQLGPEGKAFVALLLKLKPIFDQIRLAAQKGLFPGLGQALSTFAQLAPIITPAVEKMGRAIGDAAKKVADVTKSPIFRGQLSRILESSAKIMGNVGRIVANLVQVFFNIADASRPFNEWLAKTAEGWTEQWKAMTSGKKNQKKLTDFFDEAKQTLEVVGKLLFNFAKGLLGIGKASKGVGKQFLDNLATTMQKFADWANSKEGQERIKKWFQDVAPAAQAIARSVASIVGSMLKVAADPGIQKFWDRFANEIIPALTGAFEHAGSTGLGTILDLLVGIGAWLDSYFTQFTAFVDNVAYFVSLLPGIGGTDDAHKKLADFLALVGGGAPSGLGLMNSALETLKALIQWFSGDDSSSKGGGGGSWGDTSPLKTFGSTIDWLSKKLQQFLDWVLKNWPALLLTLINPFAGAILWMTGNWSRFSKKATDVLQQVLDYVKSHWSQLLGLLSAPLTGALAVWNTLGPQIKHFFQDLWDTVKLGANDFVDGLTRAIDRIRGVFADPISFVINTVLNAGLIDGFNSLISKVTGNDKLNIPHIPAPAFATGGVYPGYTPGRDIGYIGVSGGEAIMRPEWTRAVGKNEVDRMNAAARRGGKKGVQRYLGGFANGGVTEGGGGDFSPTTFRGKRMNYRTIKMLLAAEKLYGGQFSITQGSYSTAVAASGGTHAGGGVLDLGWTGSNTQVADLRRVGFAAWHRNPSQGPWADHVHIVALGDPTESEQAKKQVAAYLAGGNGLGGKDDGPRVAIDTNLANELGITAADIAAAQKGGGGFLSDLVGWVKDAIGNPLGYLKDKIAAPVQDMFAKFGNGVLTQVLSKVPEMAFSAMTDVIKGQVGNFLGDIFGNDGSTGGSKELHSLVQQHAAKYGWDTGQNWSALQWIINKESSWNPTAQNPNSSAYGLFQFLDSTWGAFGGHKTSDPGAQTDMGLAYIKQRYGNPAAAQSFHEMHGWYASGGVVPQAFAAGGHVMGVGNRDTVPAMLTPGEFVLRKDVVKSIGLRKLQALNNKKAGKLKPTDNGIQAFHAGGPVLGIHKGMTGTTVRALRYLLNMPTGAAATYGLWDSGFDKVIRQPGAWKKLSNTWTLPNRDPRYAKLANFLRTGAVKSYVAARDYLHVNDATMMKVWEGMRASTTKTMPAARWSALDKGYRQKRGELYSYVGVLNKALGLGLQGEVWNGNSRAAMKHVLEHVYGTPHDPLEYRPWLGGFTPVETAAQNAIAANKKLNEFNGYLEILSTWGLTDLVKDLLDKGVDEGYNIAQSASQNKTVATILNGQIKQANLLTAEDQANLLTMISTLAGSAAAMGLRDVARALGLSDLDTVLLFEKATSLGRLKSIPSSKQTKLKADIASFRAGTFYAATGGQVPGHGSGDTVPAMLTPGEFVLRKAAVQALGLDTVQWLNNPQKFAAGGLVNQFSLAGTPQVRIPNASGALRTGSAGASINAGVVNQWDIDIHNPVAESSTKSLTKVLQRQSVISGANATKEA